MNKITYFNYIEEKLSILAYRVKLRGKLNLLELNIHSETFFADLCNIIFNLKLINLNSIKQNTEGIDLIDTDNKVVIQISSICTKTKIESSLNKKILEKYSDYHYMFISISDNATESLNKENFKNPYNLKFEPSQDILDIKTILKKVLYENIDKQRFLYDFIKKELGQEVDYTKIESNLAKIINILAKENLEIVTSSPEINSFAIEEKINFNNLQEVRETIDDYKIFYKKLDEIYKEFDKEGKNISFSILQEIRRQYIKLKEKKKSSKYIFYEIINNIINIITSSSNYETMPIEELQICVDILIVDAFIRCKIFKNPKGYNHVITR